MAVVERWLLYGGGMYALTINEVIALQSQLTTIIVKISQRIWTCCVSLPQTDAEIQ